jgi:2-oxoisovalerate dehydrogenase E1 component beta subunit
MAQITLVEAVNLALRREMERDAAMVVLGQDVGRDGGVFRATLGLLDAYGPERVIDTPLAEGLIAGMAIGMAVEGLHPVAEIQFSGFAYTILDQVLNHAGRMRYRTRGRLACPLVIRTPCGAGIHAPEHHSESPEAMFAHIPGIRVVYPSSPRRAYGLLLAAIRDPDTVIFLEPTRLYRLFKEEVADDGAALALDTCYTLREGTDATIVSWGAMVHEALAAADDLAELGIVVEVIDVATLKPLDMDTILASVARTGRCVIATEGARSGSFASEIAAGLAGEGLLSLLAPVQRVTGYDTPVPLARMERSYMPDKARIMEAVRKALEFS